MAGLVTTFGAGAMTNSIQEIREADLLFVIGSNTTEAHPIIAMEMKRAVGRGATLVVADPRSIWLSQIADKHLQLRPGTDVWLLNAMAHVIVTEGLIDKDFIANHTEGYESVAEAVQSYTPEEAEKVTGIPPTTSAGPRGATPRPTRLGSITPWASPSIPTAPTTSMPSPIWC